MPVKRGYVRKTKPTTPTKKRGHIKRPKTRIRKISLPA